MKKTIWITWERQRRNRELSSALGIRLYELADIGGIRNRCVRYMRGVFTTLAILRRERPTLVVCQNPSMVLAFMLIIGRPAVGYQVCVDAHNAGLFPCEGSSGILSALARWLQRKADLTIVTNAALKRHVEVNGGSAFVLPDKIPDIRQRRTAQLKGRINILFICTYASDEPFELVFEVARHIDPDIYIYVSGNYKKHGIHREQMPENVFLTGFLSDEEYEELLNSVDITIDLTSREHCLVCGAYESVAVEKPMILSNTMALRDYFSLGAVYSDHTCESLRDAIHDAVGRSVELAQDVRRLKRIRTKEWEAKKTALQGRLKFLTCSV